MPCVGCPGPSGVIIEKSEIAYNNTRQLSILDDAGGTKFVGSDGMIVRGNEVHDNYGAGLWWDGFSRHARVYDNVVYDNRNWGIFWELSYGGTRIHDNTLTGNGVGDGSQNWVGKRAAARLHLGWERRLRHRDLREHDRRRGEPTRTDQPWRRDSTARDRSSSTTTILTLAGTHDAGRRRGLRWVERPLQRGRAITVSITTPTGCSTGAARTGRGTARRSRGASGRRSATTSTGTVEGRLAPDAG